MPSGSRSGLLKCFVRRERCASDGSVQGRRITFYLGKDAQQPHRARFLLCALQRGRHSTHLYLNSRGEGAPCARLTSNLLCTGYTLTLEESSMPGAPGSLTDDSLVFYPGCGPSNSHPGHMRRASVDSDGMLPWYSNSPPGAMQHPAEGGTEEIRTEMSLASAPSASGVDGGSKGKVPADGASAPPVLLTLQYKARLKGLMQPRRMDVALPDPAQAAGAAYMAQQPGPAGARRQAALNALTQVSAVAVLETPAGTPESASSLGPASPSNDVPVVAGEEPLPAEFPDGGARYAPKPSGGALRSLLCGGGLLRSARTAPEEAAPLPVHLHNKSPHWNDGLRCWCLNFRGRVKLASVKNFQLVRTEDAAEKVVMQFGKIDEDTFILDFNPMGEWPGPPLACRASRNCSINLQLVLWLSVCLRSLHVCMDTDSAFCTDVRLQPSILTDCASLVSCAPMQPCLLSRRSPLPCPPLTARSCCDEAHCDPSNREKLLAQ